MIYDFKINILLQESTEDKVKKVGLTWNHSETERDNMHVSSLWSIYSLRQSEVKLIKSLLGNPSLVQDSEHNVSGFVWGNLFQFGLTAHHLFRVWSLSCILTYTAYTCTNFCLLLPNIYQYNNIIIIASIRDDSVTFILADMHQERRTFKLSK